MADITAAGPFSVFEGLDRQAVVRQGARLRLRAEVAVHRDTVLHLPPARHLFIYVMAGDMELALPHCRTQGLSAGQVLHLQNTPAQALLVPCRVGSWVVVTVVG